MFLCRGIFFLTITWPSIICFDTRLAHKLKDASDNNLKRAGENEMGVIPVNSYMESPTKPGAARFGKDTSSSRRDHVLPVAPRPFFTAQRTTTDESAHAGSHRRPFFYPGFKSPHVITENIDGHFSTPRFKRRKTTTDFPLGHIRPRPLMGDDFGDTSVINDLNTTNSTTKMTTPTTLPTILTTHRRFNNTYVRKRMNITRRKPKRKFKGIIIIPTDDENEKEYNDDNDKILYGNLVNIPDVGSADSVDSVTESYNDLTSKCFDDDEVKNVKYVCIPILPTVHTPKRTVIINKNRRELTGDEIRIMNRRFNKLIAKNTRRGFDLNTKNIRNMRSKDDVIFIGNENLLRSDEEDPYFSKKLHIGNDRRPISLKNGSRRSSRYSEDRWVLPDYLKNSRMKRRFMKLLRQVIESPPDQLS